MLNLIKNGDFYNQIFHPWHSNDYPGTPVMPHYQGSSFSVLLTTGNLIQQNVLVKKDQLLTVSWEFNARLVADSGDQGAKISTGLFTSTDHEDHVTIITNREWQIYTWQDQQPVSSSDGYLGIVFSDLLSMPDPGIRTTVQMTGFKLWVNVLSE